MSKFVCFPDILSRIDSTVGVKFLSNTEELNHLMSSQMYNFSNKFLYEEKVT